MNELTSQSPYRFSLASGSYGFQRRSSWGRSGSPRPAPGAWFALRCAASCRIRCSSSLNSSGVSSISAPARRTFRLRRSISRSATFKVVSAPRNRWAPGQSIDARHQLGEGERLHQIVVAPRLQTLDAVIDTPERRQQENGRLDARAPNRLDQAEAVEARAAFGRQP